MNKNNFVNFFLIFILYFFFSSFALTRNSRSVMTSNHLIHYCPLLLLPLTFPSIMVFSNGSVLCIRWSNIGISPSASVLPMNIQDWFTLEWTGWISLQSRGLSRVFSNTTVQRHQFFSAQPSLWSNSYVHTWLLEKTIALTIQTFVSKVKSLHFNTLSRFVIAFLPRSKRLLISWLQSQSAVILEPDKMWSTGEGNGKPLRYSYLT